MPNYTKPSIVVFRRTEFGARLQ